MADVSLRELQRELLRDNISLPDYLHHLRRCGAPIWDWLPYELFQELPLERKVEIFTERWPWEIIDPSRHEHIHAELEGTRRYGRAIIWADTGPDSPSVGEVLHESLDSISLFYHKPHTRVFWISLDEMLYGTSPGVGGEVENIWRLIYIMRSHGLLVG